MLHGRHHRGNSSSSNSNNSSDRRSKGSHWVVPHQLLINPSHGCRGHRRHRHRPQRLRLTGDIEVTTREEAEVLRSSEMPKKRVWRPRPPVREVIPMSRRAMMGRTIMKSVMRQYCFMRDLTKSPREELKVGLYKYCMIGYVD